MTLKLSDNPPICFPDDVLTQNVDNDQLWRVVYTKPRHEKTFALNLKQRNLNYFLPLIKQKQPSNRRIRFTMAPLFTSYVFIKVNNDQRIDALKTNRVVQMLDVANQDLLIKELDIIHRSILNRDVEAFNSDIKAGTKVKIIEGPLFGLEGIMMEYKNATSLIVEIESVNKTIRIEIGSDKVEVIK